jgi:MFS family permease
MIAPLLPLFVTVTLGAGPAALGVIEGAAESTAALLKLVSGLQADRVRRRKPMVLVGYTLAGLVRPCIAFATGWTAVLVIRFADRVGKGIRTSPRDALVADLTRPEERGRAYGFQRALDHTGAVLGPLVAAGLLGLGLATRQVFLLAAVPAAVVIALIVFGVREVPREAPGTGHSWWRDLGALPPSFRMVALALGVFTLGNSTDAFLLLRLADLGLEPGAVALAWAALHGVKAVSAWLGGALSDRLGRRPLVLAGWAWYAACYVGFALAKEPTAFVAVFLVYGLYHGVTEPVEKAWVAEMAPTRLRGAAFGVYHAVVGLAALPASLLTGLIWRSAGPAAALGVGAVLAGVAWAILLAVRPVPRSASRLP